MLRSVEAGARATALGHPVGTGQLVPTAINSYVGFDCRLALAIRRNSCIHKPSASPCNRSGITRAALEEVLA
jgi:hypothetical protein